MTAAYTGTSAARRRRMLREQEEEHMTGYASGDLNGDWEFKIVHSETPIFQKREVMDRLIEEEAQAGWILLEKLDDRRIRFKRPRSARTKDTYLPPGVDPYRSHYGPSINRSVVVVALLTAGLTLFLVLGIVAFLVFALASR